MDAVGCSVEQRVGLADQVVLQPGCWMHGASGLGDRRVVADGAGTWQPAGSRPVVLCRVAQSRCLSEGGVEVVPEVVNVFAADAEAQESGGYVFLFGKLAAPLDGALDAAQAGGVDNDVQGVAEPVGGADVGALEGQHGTEAGHLRGGGAVSGVAGQAGVAYAADGGVPVEPAGEFAGVGLAAVE